MSGAAVDSVLTTRRIVELACRAPSVHNTQPWAWRIGLDRIELYADWSRRLPASDPDGRNLVISCGAALHHAQVAAAALGFDVAVTTSQVPLHPQHLATLDLTPGTLDRDAADDLRALELRSTNRQRFTDWPIPDGRLSKLAASVTQDGVLCRALTDVADRFRVELLVSRALTRQTHDQDVVAEQRLWIDHGLRDGVPAHAVADRGLLPLHHRSRFASEPPADAQPEVRIGSDGLLVLATGSDDPGAWLRTGEALSALWLHATADGLSVVPLSQVIEVDETRQAVRFGVLDGTMAPQILVRIGWQEIGTRPRTPRRPVDDVLLP
jgi:hypothetical protein